METLCLIIDTVAFLLVLYFSRKNDQLRPGEPETGFFRIAAPVAQVKKSPYPAPRRGRVL